MALLSVEDVTRRFGGIVALDEVSLAADEGTITGLIGPNGAGKTTLFNVITRLYRPDSGRVDFDGKDLLKTRPHRVIRTGIARTFQNVVLFPTMTVAENILVGAHTRLRPFGERQGAKLAPRANALVVVIGALMNRGAGQIGDIGCRTDVVRMEVRDDDAGDRRAELVEDSAPSLPRVRHPEAGVDHRPPTVRRGQEIAVHVVDAERHRERHAPDSTLELNH